jgi:predicted Mrr-cat superfamily restriction endonuclease
MNKKPDSASQKSRIWGIRAGKGGEAHDLFVTEMVIALADASLGDLAKLPNSRDDFYTAYRKTHPEETRTGSAGIAGKFFRFIFEVRVGDLVVYPALSDKAIYVGSVSGDYAFDKSSPFPHQRSVVWKFMIPKSDFSLAARYELGAARTFFEFKKNAKELLARIGDKSAAQFQSNVKVK